MVTMTRVARGATRGLPRGIAALLATALLGVTLATPAMAAVPAEGDPVVDTLLQKRLSNPRVGSDVGMVVVDATTGELVSARNADALMLPASNMKIITAVNVLATLGADARFRTPCAGGPRQPTSSSRAVAIPCSRPPTCATSPPRRHPPLTGDQKVTVHVDSDLFAAPGRGPGWTTQYLPYVAAPVVPLARIGEYSPDPAHGAAAVFVRALRDLKVKARLGEPQSAEADAGVIADISPHTAADAVAVMLRDSENNVAEVLYRQVALATGHEATWAGAEAAAHESLAKLGIDDPDMRLLDGSGLSRKDRVSPRFLSEVLRKARTAKGTTFAPIFADNALPISGRSGTLASRYGRFTTKHSRCARGDVHAKTGSLFDTIGAVGDGGDRDRRGADLLDPGQPSAAPVLGAVDPTGPRRTDGHDHRLLALAARTSAGRGQSRRQRAPLAGRRRPR